MSNKFTDLVKKYAMDPKKDFMHANLSGVDFSFCDITGYSFYGSDLTNCTGVDVTFDQSTIIENADVDGSFFQYEYLIRRRTEDKRFNSRKNNIAQDELHKAEFISDVIKDINSSEDDALIAKSFLHETESSFDINAGLFALRKREGSGRDFYQLATSLLAKHYDRDKVVSSIAFLLGIGRQSTEYDIKLLLSLVKDKRFPVALNASNSLSSRKTKPKDEDGLFKIIFSDDWKNHRIIVGKTRGSKDTFAKLKIENGKQKFVEWIPDFKSPINIADLEDLYILDSRRLSYITNSDENSQVDLALNSQNPPLRVLANWSTRNRATDLFRQIFDENGVIFTFTPRASNQLEASLMYKRHSDRRNRQKFMSENTFRIIRKLRSPVSSIER